MTENRTQSGYVLVTMAVLSAVIFGFVALTIDVGIMYRNKAQVQQIADDAALAGAFAYVTDPNASNNSVNQRVLAVTTAQTIAGIPAQVNFQVPASKRVTVTITSPVTTNPFAGVLSFFPGQGGLRFSFISATAIAEIYNTGGLKPWPIATSAIGVKPWFLPTSLLVPGSPCTVCAATANKLIHLGAVPTNARNAIGIQATGFVFSTGPALPTAVLLPNQFYAMTIPGAAGLANYTSNIKTNSTQTISCNTVYPLEGAGLMASDLTAATAAGVGPGAGTLIGNTPDTWSAVAQYQHSGSMSDISVSLVAVPIWDPCTELGFCSNGLQVGQAATPKVVGFALIFVDAIQPVSGNVSAHIVNIAACSGTTVNGAAPYGIPVRLVRLS